jgi:excisionase family DNA binding protein
MTLASTEHPNERPRRRLGTVKDLQRLLPVARNTIYDSARLGKLPGVVKVGRRVLFDLDRVEAWIDQGGAQ